MNLTRTMRRPIRRRAAVAVVVTLAGAAALAGGTTLLAEELPGSPPSARPTAGHVQRSPAPAISPDGIQGHVSLPVVGKVDASNQSTFPFAFYGSVNASPDQWYIAVDVLSPASADPGDEANWVYNVATFRTTGSGPDYTFSQPGITPFASLPDAWKPGGLGRMRVVAAMNDDPDRSLKHWTVLPVRDVDGITPANPTTIVVADASPDPTLPPGQTLQSIKDPHNAATPNYLSANHHALWYGPDNDAKQTAATLAYYGQIQTTPRGDGSGQSIQQALPTLQAFINRYFGPFECSNILNTPETVTKYFNKGDLGIGREMHCINRGCTGELACYVKNFGKADGTPVFNNPAQAKTALVQNHPFATVAMVERQLMATNAANRVFFAAYNYIGGSSNPANTQLLIKAQLDNKGYNTSMPGNCLQCHGINATYTAHGTHQIKNAIFLPFDLNSFFYFSTDPNNVLSRAKQEPAFRTLNRMVRSFSSLFFSPEARDLVSGWYGGDLFNGTFNGNYLPAGWQDATAPVPVADQQQLYRKFIAVGCRTCHISYIPSADTTVNLDSRPFLKFAKFSDLLTNFVLANGVTTNTPVKELVKSDVCGSHFMPAAEQTLKILWQSAGRSHFFAQLPGEFGECAP